MKFKDDINNNSEQIYSILGDGYGFNGSREAALEILNSRLEEMIMRYSKQAFDAAKQGQDWKTYYLQKFI